MKPKNKIIFLSLVSILVVLSFQNCGKGNFRQQSTVNLGSTLSHSVNSNSSAPQSVDTATSPQLVDFDSLLIEPEGSTSNSSVTPLLEVVPNICQFSIKKYLDMGFTTTYYSQLDKISQKLIVYKPDALGNMKLPVGMSPYTFDLYKGSSIAVSYSCSQVNDTAKLSVYEAYLATQNTAPVLNRVMGGMMSTMCGEVKNNFLSANANRINVPHESVPSCSVDSSWYYYGNSGGAACSEFDMRAGNCCPDGTTQAYFQLYECR